jgi:predicted RNase H-like nuclease (RuvC/YqgF family)
MKSIIVDGSCYNFSDDETFINARDSVISSWNKEWQTAPSSTVELNTFTVKFALEHLKSIFKTGTPIIVEFEQAISKAESKDPQPTKADQHVDRLKTAIAGLQNDRSNIIKVLNSVQDRVNNLEDRLSPVTAKAQTQVPVNTPALSIQDQVNELRKEVRDVQTRLSEIASTVSRSNLSQHIRLGGVEPNNL